MDVQNLARSRVGPDEAMRVERGSGGPAPCVASVAPVADDGRAGVRRMLTDLVRASRFEGELHGHHPRSVSDPTCDRRCGLAVHRPGPACWACPLGGFPGKNGEVGPLDLVAPKRVGDRPVDAGVEAKQHKTRHRLVEPVVQRGMGPTHLHGLAERSAAAAVGLGGYTRRFVHDQQGIVLVGDLDVVMQGGLRRLGGCAARGRGSRRRRTRSRCRRRPRGPVASPGSAGRRAGARGRARWRRLRRLRRWPRSPR